MTDATSPTDPAEPLVPPPGRTWAPLVAGLLTLVEATILLVLGGFYGYEMAVGAADSLTTAATSGALILVFGIALLVLARGWARRQSWARTPTLVWNGLLLPVAWSLFEAEQVLLAAGLGVLAIASLVAAIAAPASHQDPSAPGA